MSVQHFNTQSITSGLPRERLAALTWREVAELRGVARAMVVTDLDKYDIRPLVRVNPLFLGRLKKGAKTLTVHLGDLTGEVELTEEFRPLRASAALFLDVRRKEEPGLGGPGTELREMADGYGGKQWVPTATAGIPDLIEIKMPHEVPSLVVATS